MRKIIILILNIFLLGSCNNRNNKDNYNNIIKDLDFIDQYNFKGLKPIDNYIDSLDDFIYSLDYLTFYKVDKKISFIITDDYRSGFYNIYQEYRSAYNSTDIAYVYPIEFKYDLFNKYNLISVKIFYSDIAINKPSIFKDAIPIYQFDYKNNYNNNNHILPLYENNLGLVEVNNSEELFYTVSKGYYPVIKENSVNELIFNKAEHILSSIINERDDEFNKAKQIYNYLCSEIYYDYVTADKDSYDLNKEQCYFLEGVFLNEIAVCDGLSKAYSFLCSLEGIEIYKVNAFKESTIGHAYNYIKLDNKYYLSCTTFGSHRITYNNKNYILPSYNMFLVNKETPYLTDWGYQSNMYSDIYNQIEDTDYDYYSNTFINGMDLNIDSIEKFNLIFDYLRINNRIHNIELEFKLINSDINIDLLNDSILKKYPSFDVFFVQNVPFRENRYSLILLNI